MRLSSKTTPQPRSDWHGARGDRLSLSPRLSMETRRMLLALELLLAWLLAGALIAVLLWR